MSRGTILARNVVYNFTSQVFLIFLSLAATPYIVHKLGTQAYGVLSIALILSGFMSALEFKISNAIFKYISEADARKENSEIEKIIKASIAFYLIVGVVGAVIIASLTGFFITRVFKIPDNLKQVSYWVFYITAFVFLVKISTNIFKCIIIGLRRFDIYNSLNVLFTTLQVGGNVVILYLGYYLKAIFLWSALIFSIELMVSARAAKCLLPRIRFQIGFDLPTFKKLFNFGSRMAIHDICSTAIVSLDKILIGIFLPINFLPFYVIPYNLAQRLQLISISFSQVILPEASGLYGLKRKISLKELYYRSTKYLVVILFPISLLIIIFARPLLYFWLGRDFAQNSTLVLQIMGASVFLLYSISIASTIVSAIGRPGIMARAGIFALLLNVSLCLLLIPLFKVNGAALAFGLSTIPASLWILKYVLKEVFSISYRDFLNKQTLRLFISCSILTAYLSLLKIFIFNSLLTLLLSSFGVIVYILLIYFYIFDTKDREIIHSYFKFFK